MYMYIECTCHAHVDFALPHDLKTEGSNIECLGAVVKIPMEVIKSTFTNIG